MDKIKLALLKSQLIAAEATFEEEPTLKNELRYERAEQKLLKYCAKKRKDGVKDVLNCVDIIIT